MSTKTLDSMSERYEAPDLTLLSIEMEGIICQSSGSIYDRTTGLRDISGDDVTDLSDSWIW